MTRIVERKGVELGARIIVEKIVEDMMSVEVEMEGQSKPIRKSHMVYVLLFGSERTMFVYQSGHCGPYCIPLPNMEYRFVFLPSNTEEVFRV